MLRWLREVAEARSERVVPVAGGVALMHCGYPAAHDHHRLLLTGPVDAATAADEADRVLGGAGLAHRGLAVSDSALADALTAGLLGRGYSRADEVLMVYRGPLPAAQIGVVELDLDERIAVATAGWRAEQPDWPAQVCGQLGGRARTLAAAVDATFLGIRVGGRVVAHADLYVREGIAQVEEVMTDPAARRQGHASTLVREAVRRAGDRVVFLVADADERPAELYRRLGFVDLALTASFER